MDKPKAKEAQMTAEQWQKFKDANHHQYVDEEGYYKKNTDGTKVRQNKEKYVEGSVKQRDTSDLSKLSKLFPNAARSKQIKDAY